MPNETISISSPVKIESDSPSRVAFDLAVNISYSESDKSEPKDRRYWLTLYRQCFKAVNGHTLKSTLLED